MRRLFIILSACHRNIYTVDGFERATTAPIIERESQTKDDNYNEAEKIYVQDDCVIISADDGLYSYKLGDTSQKYIIKSEDAHEAFLPSDIDGNLLVQWYIPGQHNGFPWLVNYGKPRDFL